MAELRVTKVDDDLMAKLKAAAALARLTIPQFVIQAIVEKLRFKNGRKRP